MRTPFLFFMILFFIHPLVLFAQLHKMVLMSTDAHPYQGFGHSVTMESSHAIIHARIVLWAARPAGLSGRGRCCWSGKLKMVVPTTKMPGREAIRYK